MELTLKPNEEIKLDVLFEPLEKLLPLAPLTLVIDEVQNGDLSLKKYNIVEPPDYTQLFSGDRAEDFIINLFAFCSTNGCKVHYRILQSKKYITAEVSSNSAAE